jgi:predicted phage-related endonuclease
MQQMMVLGVDHAAIAVRFGTKKQMHAFVDRDETLCRKIIYAGNEFWKRVQDRNPPPVDGSTGTARALLALYPQDSGEQIELDASLEEVAATLAELKKTKKLTEAAITQAENRIKEAMKEATIGVFPGGGGFTWKKQEKQEYTVKASSTRVLRPIKIKEE